MSNHIFLIILLMISFFGNVVAVNFKDVTATFLGKTSEGVLAAFGDFNADKHTDIFLINEKDNSIDVLLAPEQKPYLDYNQPYERQHLIASINDTITSVVPGDYDGDAQMDILVTMVPKSSEEGHKVTVCIYYGKSGSVKVGLPYIVTEEMLDEPLVFDYNADMIPDMLGQTQSDKLSVWLGNKSKEHITEGDFTPSGSDPLRIPHSNAFLDLDNDYSSDLMLTTKNNTSDVWTFQNGEWVLNRTTEPLYYPVLGQATFADFDASSVPDQVLPVCKDTECKHSAILINTPAGAKSWHNLSVNFGEWGFVLPSQAEGLLEKLPITMRVGDFNLDGYPDLVIVLQSKDGTMKQEAYILENVPCDKRPACDNPSGRTFSVNWENPIKPSSEGTIQMVTVFDLAENGILDLMVVENVTGTTRIRALQNQFDSDACFIKVVVVSGLCSSNCPHGQQPYGVNQPGPSIKYQTISPDGSTQHSCASQLSQSAHFALQLPYVLFGLGMSPNFVDKLTVGIPTDGEKRMRSWTQIIPNSQLIVIPYPYNKPSRWKNKLFVTPSRLVLLTAAALLGTCGFIAGLIGILHWREKREDKLEKRQDAHKFHFDAM